MSSAIEKYEPQTAIIAAQKVVVAGGNTKVLAAIEKEAFAWALCKYMGMDPVSMPVEYIEFQRGIETLYVNATGSAQLALRHQLSVDIKAHDESDRGLHIVWATATGPSGRTVQKRGIVDVTDLKGLPLANAMMKAETKAHRRAVLAWCGFIGAGDEIDPVAVARVVEEHESVIVETSEPAQLETLEQPGPTPPATVSCEWHDMAFTTKTRKGTLVHKIDGNFCTGEYIIDANGQIVTVSDEPAEPVEDRSEGERVLDEEIGPSASTDPLLFDPGPPETKEH